MTDLIVPESGPEDESFPEGEQPDGVAVRRDKHGVLRDSKGRLVKGSPAIPNGGRKTGKSPHRKFTWDVKAICESYNYNPIEGLIHTAATTENLTLKYKCDAELLRYCAPTLRSTEIKTEETKQVVFTWASDPTTVPTINADGTPVVEHRPEAVYEAGTVLDEVYAALQHKPSDSTN